jgi:hypothetical protein
VIGSVNSRDEVQGGEVFLRKMLNLVMNICFCDFHRISRCRDCGPLASRVQNDRKGEYRDVDLMMLL